MLRSLHTVREWLNRQRAQAIGETGPFREDLPTVPTLQPTVLLGDHSLMVPWPDVAYGIGGITAYAIGGFSCYGLTALSPGGLVVLHAQYGNPGGAGASDETRYNWTIGNSFGTTAGGPPIPDGVHSVDPTRPVAACGGTRTNAVSWIGGGGAGHTGDFARWWGNTNTGVRASGQSGFPGPIYVPQGRAFLIEGITVSHGLHGWCYFACLEAPQAPRGR